MQKHRKNASLSRMIHLPALIVDLGLILGVAAVVTLIFKKLNQPVVLGYLIAGLLVSPHIPFLPTVSDEASIKVWAEMGVIFLLFGLGLEFSFKKLAQVGKSASLIAIVEVLSMLGLGFLVGQAFGWSTMDSLFLGGILSISSTTIIVRAFEELGLKKRRFVSLVFGVLIVEDLVAILLLVLLSTVAVTQTLSGEQLVFSGLRLGFFLILWFLVGVYVLPVLLNRIRPLLNDETTLVVSIGLCLLMVILATHVGFSPALGAFVMGSLLAETKEGHRVEQLMLPVRDLFAAVFFVSVGMLIDPNILIKHWELVVIVSIVTILGKLLSTSLGTLLSGHSLKHAVQSGMSLAQIGEFSFIIATLGVTLKVTGDFLYPVAVAVSAVTTFTTPYLIKVADPFYEWIEKKLPTSFVDQLSRYQSAVSNRSGTNGLTLLWEAYGIKIILNTVMILAITFGGREFVLPYAKEILGDYSWVGGLVGLFALFASFPFLWAIVLAAPAKSSVATPARARQVASLQIGFTVARVTIGLILIAVLARQYSPIENASLLILIIFVLFSLALLRFAEPVYRAIEGRFVANLNEKERASLEHQSAGAELAPWDASLAEFVVSPNSDLVMKTLLESSIKERFGVTVTMIQRGLHRILAPGRSDIFLPGDRVFVIGNEDQLQNVSEFIENGSASKHPESSSFGLDSFFVAANSSYLNKSIRECGLREDVNGLIVGIERKGSRILSPDSGMTLQEGDLLWIVGDREKIKALRSR